jgi:hypothetical protein
MNKTIIIHAGTHKTASSYIQNRIRNNLDNFLENNIHIQKNNFLDKKIWSNFENKNFWKSFLTSNEISKFKTILISSERFSKRLVIAKTTDEIIEMLHQLGYSLKIAIFFRNQTDYLNSIYCHSIRKFYHNNNFQEYILDHLELPDDQDHLNYFNYYKDLIKNPLVEFMPIAFVKSKQVDPFIELMNKVNIKNIVWNMPNIENINVQLGVRGIWLSRKVMEKINKSGVDSNNIKEKIRDISYKNKWTEDRYWGFDQKLYDLIVEKYKKTNEQLAQYFWNCSWTDIFPTKLSIRPNEFDPLPSSKEYKEMSLLVSSLINML